MKFAIIITEDFKKDFKSLFRKYPSVVDDVENLKNELINSPQQGEPLGKDCYKIKMAISSKG
jgi:mRNA-degrading endonuclease RelE of RelBE toxin-antitoxin system